VQAWKCTDRLSGQVFDKPRGRKPRAVVMRSVWEMEIKGVRVIDFIVLLI